MIPSFPAPASLHRVPSIRFPCFLGTIRRSDFPPFFSPHFVAFVWRYPSCIPHFVPPVVVGRNAHGPGVVNREPHPACAKGKRRDLPGSWETPMWTCHVLRPRWDRHTRPIKVYRCGLPLRKRRRLPYRYAFGAQSHGLHTRCLRFVAVVAHGLYARLASGCWPALPGGVDYPLGFK
jgi:hypothetical protein